MALMKIKPLSNHQPKCNCTECNINNKLIKKPAITFEGTNIYTINGEVVTVPSTISEIMANISIVLQDRTFVNLSENKNSFQIADMDIKVLTAISSYTIGSTIGNFVLTLQNIYEVFIHRLNESFKDIKFDEPFNFNEVVTLNIKDLSKELELNNELFNFTLQYINLSPEERLIAEKSVINYATTFINKCGIYIYNSVRKDIDRPLARYSGNNAEYTINTIYDILTNCFRLMMGDMSFEISIFVNNLIATSGLFISGDEINKLYKYYLNIDK